MLCAKFQFIRKDGLYCTRYVYDERRYPLKFSWGLLYQCLNMFGLRTSYFRDGYAELTCFWKRVEVLRECCPEVSVVLFYGMEELMDSNSGRGAVTDTEWCTKIGVRFV